MLTLEPVLLIGLFIILVLIAGLVYTIFHVHRSHGAAYILDDPKVIHDLLERSLDSRSKFSLQFTDSALEGRGFSGLCAELSPQSLLIDVSLDYKIPTWQGLEVAVYFHVKQGRKTEHYQFVTKIREVRPYRSLYAFELDFPHRLNPNQKRRAVRTSIPQAMVHAIGVWTVHEPEASPVSLGKALWRYRPGFSSTVMLEDLSAGGIRIETEFSADLAQDPRLQIQKTLVLLLLLYSPEEHHINNYWFFGTIRHIYNSGDRKKVSYGIEFKRWANAADIRDDIQWASVGKDGEVPPLVPWVMRRELEKSLRMNKA